MKMKKIFAGLAMSTVLATLLATTPVQATEDPVAGGSNLTASSAYTTVSKVVENSYTWSIPATITPDGGTLEVGINVATLSTGSSVNVKLVSAAHYDSEENKFYVSNGDAGAAEVKLEYAILDSNEDPVTIGTNGTVVCTASSAGSVTTSYTTDLLDTATVAATYSDTLNFTASIATV